MTELIGILGGLAFATAFFPQIVKAYKTKSTKDVSWLLILLNYIGNIAMLTYVMLTDKFTIVFLANYGGSLALIIILTILKFIYDRRK